MALMSDRVHVLVTVSRSWRDWSEMRRVLELLYRDNPAAVLMHGDEPTGDQVAARMWKRMGGDDQPVPAVWELCDPEDPKCTPEHRKVNRRGTEYCPTAGHRRNDVMIASHPDLCVAFVDPKSRTKGAQSTASKAKSAGIPTVRYNQETNHG